MSGKHFIHSVGSENSRHSTCNGSYSVCPENGDKLVIYGTCIEPNEKGEAVLSTIRKKLMEVDISEAVAGYDGFFNVFITVEKTNG